MSDHQIPLERGSHADADAPDKNSDLTTRAIGNGDSDPFLEDREPVPSFPSRVRVFVIMPFGNRGEYQGGSEEADFVYNEIIALGVKRAFDGYKTKLNIVREVDKSEAGSITSSIVHSLAKSDIVVVDVTGQNPNVFLELGIRYSLKNKITVLLTQEPDKIPFDIQGYRFLSYRRFDPERGRASISAFVRQGFTDATKSDSVVFDVFENMSVIIPNVSESHGPTSTETRETLSWEGFVSRVRYAIQILERPIKDGRYTPDALVGISVLRHFCGRGVGDPKMWWLGV